MTGVIKGARAAGAVLLSLALHLAREGSAEADGPPPKGGDEAAFAEAMGPAEALIKAWDFAGAEAALAKLRFEPPELAERLATRRAEVALLAGLKGKMIAKINGAKPRLRKGTLLIPGFNGDLVSADEEAIVAEIPGKGAEKHAWKNLSPKSLGRLIQRSADPKNADDQVASALVALMQGDVATAEASFVAARALGAKVDRHLVVLADAALAKATALVEQERYQDLGPALAAIEGKYAGTKWLADHQEAIAALRIRATGRVAEAEAEKLYAEAVGLFKAKDIISLKPLVEKLKADFANTAAVRDAARKPSLADMAEAVAKLGKVLVVRRDGKGDFDAIQPAIEKAPPGSTIVIADNGPYDECPRIPAGKDGLTLMGKRGCWPVITSRKFQLIDVENLMRIDSSDVTLRGLALAHSTHQNLGGSFAAVRAARWPVRLRSCIVYIAWHGGWLVDFCEPTEKRELLCDADHCVFAAKSSRSSIALSTWKEKSGAEVVVANSVWLHGGLDSRRPLPGSVSNDFYRIENCVLPGAETFGPVEFRSCTIERGVRLEGKPNLLLDCIVGQVNAANRETKIEHCNVYGTPAYAEFAQPGRGCFSSPPDFQDPGRSDYRLRPTSPCRKKASDGGDVGCRYTGEMLEIVQKALELRDKGFISF